MTALAIATIIVLGLVAIAALAGSAWLVERVYRQAVALNRSHDETAAKGTALVMQTSAAISERIDTRVRERVGLVQRAVAVAQDAAVAGAPPPPPPVGEMPAMHVTGYIDDEHEMRREEARTKRPGADPVRDDGIGHEIPPMPSIATEAL